MKPQAQNAAHVISIPASVATNATHTVDIDTRGYSYAQINLIAGTAGSTAVPTALSLSEGDTTSSVAAIAAFALTNSFTATTKTTSEQVLASWGVCLQGRKRYLRPAVTPGVATICAWHVELLDAAQAPTTTTLRNVTSQVNA